MEGWPGWRAVFPNEKREHSTGCTEDRRAGCTKGGSAGCGKGLGRLQKKRAALRPTLFCSPAYCAVYQPTLMCRPLAHPVVQLARPSVQLAGSQKIHVFHLATWPSSPPFSVILLNQTLTLALTLTPTSNP